MEKLIQSMDKLIDILNKLTANMECMKDNLDEMYITTLELAKKERKEDKAYINTDI